MFSRGASRLNLLFLPTPHGESAEEEYSTNDEIGEHRPPGAEQAQIEPGPGSERSERNLGADQQVSKRHAYNEKADPREQHRHTRVAGAAESVGEHNRGGEARHRESDQPQLGHARTNDGLLFFERAE